MIDTNTNFLKKMNIYVIILNFIDTLHRLDLAIDMNTRNVQKDIMHIAYYISVNYDDYIK
jgi:hypothetical protein